MLGLHGYNGNTGTNKIIANRDGSFKVLNETTGVWTNVATPVFNGAAQINAINFLNKAWFVNGVSANANYDGSSWSTTTDLGDSPIASLIAKLDVHIYLGDVILGGARFRSRVWFSDPPKNNGIVWGLETASDLSQSAGSAIITSAGSLFKTRNIKVGDPFFITTGTNAGEYVVRSIDSETQITLTTTLTNAQTNSSFWAGGNWFDVMTDDGDILKAIVTNSNQVLCFKQLSVHRYNKASGTLTKIKDAPGTSSGRSVVNLGDYSYYYDSSGPSIRRTEGTTSVVISEGIEDVLQSITDHTAIVGYKRNNKVVEMYLGDVTTRDGDTINKCVAMWDTITETWSFRSIPFVIEQTTEWIVNGKLETYVGTSDGKVLKVGDGYKYDTFDISFLLEDRPFFPIGEDTLVDMEKIRLFVEKGHDMQLAYKLYYKPLENTTTRGHGDWEFLIPSKQGEMMEYVFPSNKDRTACGLSLRIMSSSGLPGPYIEEYILYANNPRII